MRGIQQGKNEANPSVMHWDIACWRCWATQNHGFGSRPSIMRCNRPPCGRPSTPYHGYGGPPTMKCNTLRSLHMVGLPNLWILVAQNLQQAISQCVTDGFASFLWHWIPLDLLHNIGYFMLYHIAELRCVFEIFNCIGQNEIWWLDSEDFSLGIRFWP